jgi:hypothetical protein
MVARTGTGQRNCLANDFGNQQPILKLKEVNLIFETIVIRVL